MRKVFQYGGVAAAVVLVAIGVASLVVGAKGRTTVHNNLKQEQIVGSPDMTPKAISAEAKKAGLASSVSLPTCSVAGDPVNDGASARCFAQYMRVHALEATGGKTYAQMPRYASPNGKGTNNPAQAKKGPSGQPVDNPARNVWINETALSTALNTSYMAERISIFGIVMGIALILAGIGFGILALGGTQRRREEAEAVKPAPAAPAAA